jgi:hypothetical protein
MAAGAPYEERPLDKLGVTGGWEAPALPSASHSGQRSS